MPQNYLFFVFFLVLAIFWTFPCYSKSKLWTCKNQFSKLQVHNIQLSFGTAGLKGGSAAIFASSVYTCVRVRHVTVLSYLAFTPYKLSCRPLLGHRNTILSAFYWFAWLKLVILQFLLTIAWKSDQKVCSGVQLKLCTRACSMWSYRCCTIASEEKHANA